MLLAALALATVFESPAWSAPSFGPTKIASANGWQLSIRPLTTDGLHGAEYMLRAPGASTSGTPAWAETRSYFLRDAVVSDRGWIYGSAVVAPPPDRSGDPRTILVLALDAEGVAHVEDRIPTVAGRPWVVGPVAFEPFGKLLMRVNPTVLVPQEEDWWIYDLNTGKRTAECHPFPRAFHGSKQQSQGTQTLAVVPIAGLPLFVAQALRRYFDTDDYCTGVDDRWAVFDLEGKCVWAFDDVRDPSVKDWKGVGPALALRRGALPTSKQNEFETLANRTKERVTYTVTLDPTTKAWSVIEKSRVPVKSALPPKK